MSREDSDRQLALGVAWVGGLRLLTQLISWSATLVVVRLISPLDYGIAGMASLYITIATLLVEGGIAGAIVAGPRLTSAELSQLHSVAFAFGVIGCGISLALAWPLGAFFREPLLPPVVAVMSVGLLLTGARTVPRAILQRQLQYRMSALIDAARTVVQMIVVLGGAALGLGYWALAFGAVAGSLTATTATLSIRNVAGSWPSLKRLTVPLHYARNVAASALAWQTYSVSDFLVIGRTRGTQALGHYTLAWNVAAVPGEKLTTLLTTVSSSFFASLRDDIAAMRRSFLLLTEGISVLTFPVLTGIGFVAADAVAVLWGEKWLAAVLPTRVLVAHAILNSLATPFSQILTATGQVVAARRYALVALVVLVPAFYLAASTLGIWAVALCWVVLSPLLNARSFALVRTTLSLRLSEYVNALRPASLITGAMLTALLVLRLSFTHGLDPRTRLIIEISGGAAICLLTLRLTYWNRIRSAWRVVRTPPFQLSASPP